jgi:hypothetical protein
VENCSVSSPELSHAEIHVKHSSVLLNLDAVLVEAGTKTNQRLYPGNVTGYFIKELAEIEE